MNDPVEHLPYEAVRSRYVLVRYDAACAAALVLLRGHEAPATAATLAALGAVPEGSSWRLESGLWAGRFLIHVGGTRRALILDESASDADVAHAFRAEEADYFAHDHHPVTE